MLLPEVECCRAADTSQYIIILLQTTLNYLSQKANTPLHLKNTLNYIVKCHLLVSTFKFYYLAPSSGKSTKTHAEHLKFTRVHMFLLMWIWVIGQ